MLPFVMTDLAHVCPLCRSATIFTPDATYPRRCAACDAIVRVATVTFDDETIPGFTIELGGVTSAVSSFERR